MRARRGAPLTEKSRIEPVDNPRRIGIDSPSSRVDLRRKILSIDRGRNRAGFVMAPLSRSIGSGTAGAAIQYLDPAASGGRGRANTPSAGAEPVRRRLGQ